jgi:lipopolysaccharide biosynthesis protein
LIGEINNIKNENAQMLSYNEYYQQNIPNLINWRESVEKYRNNIYTNENNIYLQ